ncbi:MAG: cytochrome-c oxidase, cbb3-type subunit I, partial [Hoeflea sp.]|nr:cytochrome-c oxidase, cbb3-type subunit I [Hoeflea sp.]
YDENGALSYSFIDSVRAMAPYYLLRTLGGALFLSGAILCALNTRATMRAVPQRVVAGDHPLAPQPAE